MSSPAWNPKAPRVPVDGAGNWQHYPSSTWKDGVWTDTTWEPVIPFPADLKIDSMRSGRSAKYVILRDSGNGKTYPMFVSDLLDYLKSGTVEAGVLKGIWTASKRGQNYGIKAYKN